MVQQSLDTYGYRTTALSGAAIFYALGLLGGMLRGRSRKFAADDSIYASTQNWYDATVAWLSNFLKLDRPRRAAFIKLLMCLAGMAFIGNIAWQIGVFAALIDESVIEHLIPGQQLAHVFAAAITCCFLAAFTLEAIASMYRFIMNKRA